MEASRHIAWFAENIEWFENLPGESLNLAVPMCPGWTVEKVVNHLSFGLGLAYPVGMSKGPGIAAEEAFVDVAWPTEHPTGAEALATFSTNLRQCLATFGATEPAMPCWTYAGPGEAAFWFRRAAIETTLHRFDVEDAIDGAISPLSNDRAMDAIDDAVGFALPMAGALVGDPAGRLIISIPELELERTIGKGPRQAIIVGTRTDLLQALWGRNIDRVEVIGDHDVASAWLSLVEAAFVGR